MAAAPYQWRAWSQYRQEINEKKEAPRMRIGKKTTIGLLLFLALAALAYSNRLYLFKYSLGWYTDFKFPRDPNKPVPWMAGPDVADKPLMQRPPNIIVILADDMGTAVVWPRWAYPPPTLTRSPATACGSTTATLGHRSAPCHEQRF
jgi:hypothetical protein